MVLQSLYGHVPKKKTLRVILILVSCKRISCGHFCLLMSRVHLINGGWVLWKWHHFDAVIQSKPSIIKLSGWSLHVLPCLHTVYLDSVPRSLRSIVQYENQAVAELSATLYVTMVANTAKRYAATLLDTFITWLPTGTMANCSYHTERKPEQRKDNSSHYRLILYWRFSARMHENNRDALLLSSRTKGVSVEAELSEATEKQDCWLENREKRKTGVITSVKRNNLSVFSLTKFFWLEK